MHIWYPDLTVNVSEKDTFEDAEKEREREREREKERQKKKRMAKVKKLPFCQKYLGIKLFVLMLNVSALC